MDFFGLGNLYGAGDYEARLRAAMSGQAPSVAGTMLQTSATQAAQRMAGMAGNRLGVNSALATRNAMGYGADLQAQAQQQAALARAQEQAAALQQYGQYQQQEEQRGDKFLGSGLSALGSVAGLASDERAKMGVQDGAPAADAFLDALQARQYQYRDPARFGAGPQLGVMAQDVAPVLPGAVAPGPDGTLHIDTPRLAGATAAAAGRLHDRVAALEAQMGGSAGHGAESYSTSEGLDAARVPAALTGGGAVASPMPNYADALARSRAAAQQKEALARDLARADATPSRAYNRGTAPGATEQALIAKANERHAQMVAAQQAYADALHAQIRRRRAGR